MEALDYGREYGAVRGIQGRRAAEDRGVGARRGRIRRYAPASPLAASWRAMITDDDALAIAKLKMFRFSSPDWLPALTTFVEGELMRPQ